MSALLRALAPSWVKQKYAEVIRHRHIAKRREARARASTLTKTQLDTMLSGISAGDLVMVHSALGQFNNVEGGPRGVLETILGRISDTGTLL
jgi:aminoglycoside N3'-acetyltransferase